MRISEVIFVPPVAGVSARHIGAFARHGLDVATTLTVSSFQQRDGLVDGRYDVALTAIDNVFSWRSHVGEPFVILGQIERSTRLPIYGRHGFTSIAALEGGRLGADAPDSGFVIALRLIAEAAGVALDSYRIVAVGGVKERLDALLAGEIDVALLSPPHDAAAEAAGLPQMGVVTDSFPDYPGLGIVALARSLSENAGALGAYVSALAEGIAWARAEPGAARQTMIEAGFAEAGATAVVAAVPDTIIPTGEGIRTVLEMRKRVGSLLEQVAGYDEIVDLRFVPGGQG